MYRDIPEPLRALIEPVVEDAGCELVDVLLARGRPPWLLRITIDTPAGDGRVPIERCADVSREIGTQLDAADAFPVSYRLEVTSPGLDRVLAREKDFAAACGAEVQLETRRPLDGRLPLRTTAGSPSHTLPCSERPADVFARSASRRFRRPCAEGIRPAGVRG